MFPVGYELPGVFDGLPYPRAVNGSLWTIPVEVLCYIGVALLGRWGLLRRRTVLVALLVATLTVTTAVHLTGYTGMLVPFLLSAYAAGPIAFFTIGMLARETRWRPPLWLTAAASAAWAVSWGTPLANLAAIGAVTCLTFTWPSLPGAGLAAPPDRDLRPFLRHLSAGLSRPAAARPVGIQAPAAVCWPRSAIVLPLAALSWRLIERPALRLRQPSRPRYR